MRAFSIDFSSRKLFPAIARLAKINRAARSKTKKGLQIHIKRTSHLTMARDTELELECIYNQLQDRLNEEAQNNEDEVIASIAGQFLKKQLHEFVKNAVDAGATGMYFELSINDHGGVVLKNLDIKQIETLKDLLTAVFSHRLSHNLYQHPAHNLYQHSAQQVTSFAHLPDRVQWLAAETYHHSLYPLLPLLTVNI